MSNFWLWKMRFFMDSTRREEFESAVLRDKLQKWWHFAGATVEQATKRSGGTRMSQNLRRIRARPDRASYEQDPYNLVSSRYLRCFVRDFALQKIRALSTIPCNALVRAPANSRLPRPIAERGRKPPWRQEWTVGHALSDCAQLDHCSSGSFRASAPSIIR